MKKEFDDKKYFKTSDLSLATVLTLFFNLEGMDKSNPKKILFTFLKTKKLEKIIDSYWKDKMTVSPQKFFLYLKALKNRLYTEGVEE